MAIVSYGTITITDTNDIESIIVEYNRNQSSSNAPSQTDSGWSTTRPAWAQGYYIWQRIRTHKSGTSTDDDIIGTAVCITGSTGQTGATGQSLTSTKTQYTNVASNVTITTSNHTNYTWTDNVPAYNSSNPVYWARVTNIYTNPAKTEYLVYKDQGLTDAVKTSYDANTTANAAKTKVDNLETTYNTFINTKAKYFVHNSNGSIVIASRENESSPVAYDENTVSTYGYNALTAPSYIALRYNSTELAKLSTGALIFYKPNTTNKGMELTSTALTFYNPSTNTAQLTIGANGTLQSGNYVYTSGTYSDSGTKIDLTNGSIYTPGFRTDGSNTYIRGEINALSGKIGNNSSNYWTIGNSYNYDQTASAALISHGTAFIQLDTSNTWRLSTDRIHTAWNGTDGSAALVFPKEGNTYWDWGIHAPHQNSNVWKDKFIYARKYSNTSSDDFTNRDNLSNDLDDNLGYWIYQFYVDKNGSVYARNFYLLNEDGTPGSNIGGQDSVYLLKSGGTITGNLEVNGTLTKGSKNVAYLTTTPTSGQILVADGTSGAIKTSGYTIAKSVPSNAIFTDENVKTSQANTTKIWLTGTSSSSTNTGTLNFDSNVYLTTTAGTLHATTFDGTSFTGTAAKATADGDGNTIKTTYLKLTGGNVTGPVSFGDSVSIDDLNAGQLVVTGLASFANNLQANTINGVEVGSNPKFTDTVTTVTVTGNGNAVTSASASNGTVTLAKGTTFPTGSGTNGYLTKWTGTNTIGNGPALGSDTTKFLNNKGEWAVPAGTYTLPLAANGTRGGVQIGYTTSGKNYAVQLSSEKMYVNVPWENTTYSAGTGLSLSGTTFNNTGVLSIKGNAESTYRTGQVNLTAANVGAVALSGNETVAGNKTFSGTTTLTPASVYSISNSSVVPANASAIIQSPIPKYLWHDLWAFCRAVTPKYYKTTDGTTWTEATLDKRLFYHKEAWGRINVIADGLEGSRWVWTGGGYAYSGSSWIVIGVAYSSTIAKFDVLYEFQATSGDDTTWTTLAQATGISVNQTPIWIKTNGPSNNNIRLTITRNSSSTSTTNLPVVSLMLLTTRWGNQGKGSEFEYPYNWDDTPNVYPIQNNVSSLGTSSYKWANVYATTLTGNVTGTATGNLTSVQYDTTNKKITYTKNSTNTDVVTIATIKTDLGSMPASDVYSWAKASTKPSYSYSEIGSAPDAIVDATVNSQGVIVLTKNSGGTVTLSTEIAVVESQGANKLVEAGSTTGIDVGSSDRPVYFGSGIPVAGYYIPKLNGSNHSSAVSFYAPTAVGTAKQILVSSGSGAPGWQTVATGDTNGTIKIGSDEYAVKGLAAAAYKALADSSSAGAIGTGTNVTTERDVYYGLPTINNAHNYTSSTTIYAPTSGGASTQVLTGNGTTSAPVWTSISSLVPTNATNATNAINDSDGNPINTTYLKKSGGVMTGVISRAGVTTNWNKGRDNVLIKTTSLSGYSPLWSAKTNNGSWDAGTYDNASFTDDLVFSYVTDEDYANTNRTTAQIKFLENGHIVANLDGNATSATTASKLGSSTVGSKRQAIYLNAGTATVGNYTVAHFGNAGKSNMNDVGRLHASVGMTSLTDPSNNTDNPMNGTTKSTGWHLYWDASYTEDPSGSNAWVAQIVNKAGTAQWWVRSRSGGAITNGTAWVANWKHLVVAPQEGQGSSTVPIYVDANGHTQSITSYSGKAATAGTADSATNTYNLLAYSSNETTIGANSATVGASTNDSVWFNYRDVMGGSTNNNATQITQYYFGNRKGSTEGVAVNATTFRGALSGNASTATKWASAQAVYVALGTASTTTTIQGGSSTAQTIGVNGTLGVSNGGTGNTSFTQHRLTYAETATKQSSVPTISYYTGTSTASTPATYNRLHIHGSTYGNTAATMISNASGLFSFGDGGPQITFGTTATPGEGQAGALIFTDHDSAGAGASWHFVGNQSDWNVTSKRFHARTGISIGANLPNTSYNLYVNGTSYLNGSVTVNGNTLKITNNSNTVTIGSQNSSFTHIYNSASIPFIFNNSILTTSGSLGNTTYPFTNVNINGAYNMLVSGTQKAAMHYDSTLEAIVFSFS